MDQPDPKDLNSLKDLLNEGEKWLESHGGMSASTHNEILMNLYANFPQVKLAEYRVLNDSKKLKVLLHVDLEELVLPESEWLRSLVAKVPGILSEARKAKLNQLLDLVPNLDLPIISERVERLKSKVSSLLKTRFPDFTTEVWVKRFKPEENS